jgi:hypothetical protein
MLNADTGQYRVEGAVGKTEGKAIGKAKYAALDFAARSLTGDPKQKTGAAAYVKANLKQMLGFATAGKIFGRGFDDSGKNTSLKILIVINNQALQRHLLDAGVITSSKDISKGAGKPQVLVFFAQGDCSKGNPNAPLCALPKKIKALAKEVTDIEDGIMKFQQSLVKAGCLVPTQTSVESTRSSKDKSRASSASASSSSSRASASGSASRYHASGRASRSSSGRSASRSSVQINRESTATFSAKSIKASSNCKTFMKSVGVKVSSLQAALRKRNKLQDELDTVRNEMAKNDVTTIRINEWLVNQRWEIIDAAQAIKAQRQLDAMSNVAGLPADPVAAIANMAGADVYIEHDLVEDRPDGGYRATVTIKAYEVVSAKLLASKVSPSNVMMNVNKLSAVQKAVGRGMGKIMDQITGFWADMADEGVRTKIVIRGDFSDSDVGDTIEELIDENLADEIGRKCEGKCEWDPTTSSRMTIEGYYISPPKARKKVGRKLRKLLKNEGFGVSNIIDKPTLRIVEIIQQDF